MQCKDIPTAPILDFINDYDGLWCNWFADTNRSVRIAMPTGISDKLVLAKMRKLIRSGLVDGCACGCRGDFVLTNKGREAVINNAGLECNLRVQPEPDSTLRSARTSSEDVMGRLEFSPRHQFVIEGTVTAYFNNPEILASTQMRACFACQDRKYIIVRDYQDCEVEVPCPICTEGKT